MQKFINKENSDDIAYLGNEVDAGNWIDLKKYRLMTKEEIRKNETEPASVFHTVWDERNFVWVDPRTEEDKLAYKRSQYPKLTRYQFMRGLLEMGFKSSDIEAQILLIEDEYTRELTMIGFKDAGYFVRTDSGVLEMQSVLGLSDEKVDELWEYALNL